MRRQWRGTNDQPLGLWNSRAVKFASLIMNTCCWWTSPHAVRVRGNKIVKVASLIMNTCIFLCALLFQGKTLNRVRWTLPLVLTVGRKLLLCVHKSNLEKPRVVLLILTGDFALLSRVTGQKKKRKKVCKIYVVRATLWAGMKQCFKLAICIRLIHHSTASS